MAVCPACNAWIIWCKTAKKARPTPVDARPVPDGSMTIERKDGELVAAVVPVADRPAALAAGTRLFKSHFATCRHAQRFRRPKPKANPA